MVTDYQRSKVYTWENAEVHPHDRRVVPFEHLQSLVDYIWTTEGKEYPPKVVPIPKQTRRTLATGSRLKIEAPEEGLTTSILIHELAHSLTQDIDSGRSAFHGPRFVGVYIYLLGRYTQLNALALQYSAQLHGVDWNNKGPVVIQ